VTFAQKDNEMAREVRKHLGRFGFRFSETVPRSNGVLGIGIIGERPEALRFLGQIRPRRLLAKFTPDALGTMHALSSVSVVSIEDLGDRDVVAIQTTTGTLIAEGLASHNSAPPGLHDDCVCALALAVQQLGHAVEYGGAVAVPTQAHGSTMRANYGIRAGRR
jgi:hypothetical protein